MPTRPTILKVTCPCCQRDVWLMVNINGCKNTTDSLTKHHLNIIDVVGPRAPVTKGSVPVVSVASGGA